MEVQFRKLEITTAEEPAGVKRQKKEPQVIQWDLLIDRMYVPKPTVLTWDEIYEYVFNYSGRGARWHEAPYTGPNFKQVEQIWN